MLGKPILEVQNPADLLRPFHSTDILIALRITQKYRETFSVRVLTFLLYHNRGVSHWSDGDRFGTVVDWKLLMKTGSSNTGAVWRFSCEHHSSIIIEQMEKIKTACHPSYPFNCTPEWITLYLTTSIVQDLHTLKGTNGSSSCFCCLSV